MHTRHGPARGPIQRYDIFMPQQKRSVSKDPRPEPPERPAPEDCCQSGCIPCIFEQYDEDMDRYRAELKAWQERQDARKPKATRGADGAR